MGEISETYSGGTPKVSIKSFYNKKEIPFIRSSDIHKNTTELYITKEGLEESSAKLVSKGQILYALYGATSGEVDISKIDGAINQAILAINTHDNINYFIMLFLNKNKDKIIKKYIQGGQGNLSAKIVKNININITSKKEEKEISTFIKKFEKIFTLYERKLKLLSWVKKYFLDNLFAEKEYPNLRFKGFTDAWEQRKIKDYASYRRGSFPQPYGKKEWYDGKDSMPFVQVVDVKENLRLVDHTKQRISKLAQPQSVFVPTGKVLVTVQGSIGRVAITQYPSYIDRTLIVFEKYDTRTDKYFWAYTLQRKFDIEKRKAPGGTIKTITKKALSEFIVTITNYEEQNRLGIFFLKIDKLLALYENKQQHLTEIKKTLLNTMFI